jgi:hypothetical protein
MLQAQPQASVGGASPAGGSVMSSDGGQLLFWGNTVGAGHAVPLELQRPGAARAIAGGLRFLLVHKVLCG